jgi:class 3 adenylate cyclase/tetratricopeptide (TPR) repeat protein
MRCAACGTENPTGAKFCTDCGAQLARACAGCGHPNAPTGRFCSECGHALGGAAPPAPKYEAPRAYTPRELQEKILANRAAIEGQRKQVTVLSADIAGFTPMAERLDPEDTHEIATRCFDLLLEHVHRYEGHVAQFTGDGMLALFGAPIAHEDHAQRAARAALNAQQALAGYRDDLRARGIDLRVRIGLNSGAVVVGTVGTDLNITYTASGDSVNLAARVQSMAEPGSVTVSHHTERLIRGYLETRALGERQVKGKEEPVRLFEVLRPSRWRSRVDVRADQGLSPYVGRERELQVLLDRFAEARAGRGQVVFVQGEPGIGKSRLLFEAKRRLEGEDLAWLEGRCISYGYDIAYYPIVDLLRDVFEVEETDPEGAIQVKVGLAAGALGDDIVPHLPYLKHMLAVDPDDASVAAMDPQLRKARVFEALRALLVAGAARRTQVIVVEDLHWIDAISEELLSFLADAVGRSRALLVLTHRPGYEQRLGSRPFFTTLPLQHLSESESAAVAGGLLGAGALPDELRELIFRKAEGNPFFVEEVTKSLVEVGAVRATEDGYVLARKIGEIYVPDTVQDVIRARLDRLDEEPRRAIQTAAVIGREFTVRLLERTSELEGRLGAHLRELKAIELIYERSLFPELAYMFKHALTHDVAYGSLLQSRRRDLHRLVGSAIEWLYAERLAEHYEVLAYHYERAEAWDKALDYLVKSGDKAMGAFAPLQAVAFYDRALAVASKPGAQMSAERAIGIRFNQGQALFLSSQLPRGIEAFEAMRDAARAAGDRPREGMALFQLALTETWAHRFEEALTHAEEGRRLGEEIGNQAVLAGCHFTTSFVRAVTGDLVAAKQHGAAAVEAARLAGDPSLLGLATFFFGSIDHWHGRSELARGPIEESLEIGRRHQLPLVLLWTLWIGGIHRCTMGDYDGALASLAEALELSGRFGDRVFRSRILNSTGWVYVDLCNWETAVRYNQEGADLAREIGDPEIIRNAEINLGDCYLGIGQLDRARLLLENVAEQSAQRGTWGEEWMKWRYAQHLHASLADLWLALGDPDKARGFADACLAVAEPTESRRNIVKGRRARGLALVASGDLAAAEADLTAALATAHEVANPAQLWKTLQALGDLRRAQDRPIEASTAYAEALAVVETVARRLADPTIRDTLLASSQVGALREHVASPVA